MIATISTAIHHKTANRGGPPSSGNPSANTAATSSRSPLLPSDSDNAIYQRKSKARQVTSRYLSPSSGASYSSSSTSNSTSASVARRCQTPLVPKTVNSSPITTPASLTKRSQSVERKRIGTPRPNSADLRIGRNGKNDVPAAQRLLITSSRSLSVSFQGEAFSLRVSRSKPASSPCVRKCTPERRNAVTPARAGNGGTDKADNSRTTDQQQRWPERLRRADSMSRSVDFVDERKTFGGSGVNVVRALNNLMFDHKASSDGERATVSSNSATRNSVEVIADRNTDTGSRIQFDSVASDTESVSCGSTSGGHGGGAKGGGGGGGGQEQRMPRGIVVPVRLLQEDSHRLRRQAEPGSLLKHTSTKVIGTPNLLGRKKLGVDSKVSSPKGIMSNRGMLSPMRSVVRPASPSKFATPQVSSPSRGLNTSHVRNGTAVSNKSTNVMTTLSFVTDISRRKAGEDRIVCTYLLRLLYNRLLQWRFANSRQDTALSEQRSNVEVSIHNAQLKISELRESVRAKRAQLQLLRQHSKLIAILKEQMVHLEDWALLDNDYSNSLSGAVEALRASTLRLPVVSGAKVDLLNVKEAICIAVDVMQAMASSVCLLLPKVGNTRAMVVELANVSAKEHIWLDKCKNLLSVITALQVQEASLRTNLVQLKRVSSNLMV